MKTKEEIDTILGIIRAFVINDALRYEREYFKEGYKYSYNHSCVTSVGSNKMEDLIECYHLHLSSGSKRDKCFTILFYSNFENKIPSILVYDKNCPIIKRLLNNFSGFEVFYKDEKSK